MWRRDEPPTRPPDGRPAASRRPSTTPIAFALLAAGLAVTACGPAEGPGTGGTESSAPAAAQGDTISAEDFESGDTGVFRPEPPPASPTGEPAAGSDAGSGENGG